jgi:thiaminase/transcriptional activator TenA
MSGFSERLRADNAENWNAAVNHRFVDEIFRGAVPPQVMRRYLVQDYQFIDRFVALLGSAIAFADLYPSRIRFAQFAAMITSEENTYFQRAFDSLGVPGNERTAPDLAGVTRQFRALMAEAALSRSYANALAVLSVAEWLYLEWATRGGSIPEGFIHAEWIMLHNNPEFRDFVIWMRSELDRIYFLIQEDERKIAAGYFRRAVELERGFFDFIYEDDATEDLA